MKPDLRKFSVYPPNVDSVPPIIVLIKKSSSNYRLLSEIYHPIENHCFKPWRGLVCLFCSCFICSLSLLYTGMLWAIPRTETTAVPCCLARVAFLGRDPAAVVLHVIKGSLSHLLVHSPFQNSGPEPTDWDVNRESEQQRFHHVPHWDEAIHCPLNFYHKYDNCLFSRILLAASPHSRDLSDSELN